MQNLPKSLRLLSSRRSTLLTSKSKGSLKKRLPVAGNRMLNRSLSISTILSINAILSLRVMVCHVSANSLPETRSIIIYSEPSWLEADELHPTILGIGMPWLRRNSIVATSLATPYLRGIVQGYGRRAMTFNPSWKVASKMRYESPSAIFVTSIISVRDSPTDLAIR